MLIDLMKDTSCLPSYAKKYLKILIENQHDLIMFIDNFLYQYKNIMVSIAEFRWYKLENRIFTYTDFQKEFEINRTEAVEKLFLYPHCRTVHRTLIVPLLKEKFTLEQLYNYQKENPFINSILAGKRLSQLP